MQEGNFWKGVIVGAVVMAVFFILTQYNVREDDDEVKVLIPLNPSSCSASFDTRDYINNHTLDIKSFVQAYREYCV